MKKYIVIGNPINHSLSPKLHNFWFKKNNINALYEKKLLKENEIKNVILDLKKEIIHGVNVTIPFKKKIIPFLDELTPLSEKTKAVNTIYKKNKKIIGHNTDVGGFELAIKKINYNVNNKKVFILGAGGVASSIILALKEMKVSKIIISNRTKKKSEDLKKIFIDLQVLDWGEIPEFDVIINTTSLGLKQNDEIKIDYNKVGKNKLFYDLIYNPKITNFLSRAQKHGNQIENGKMMFIYQAHQAFTIWNKIMPEINKETIDLLD
jgi:shikimate dehydrogenase